MWLMRARRPVQTRCPTTCTKSRRQSSPGGANITIVRSDDLAAVVTSLIASIADTLERGRDMVDQRQPDVETWGDYEFDSLRKTVHIKGVLIPTTALEFGLALLLFRNLSRPLSREYITQMVWDGLDSPTRSLDTYISHLRVRLKLNSKNGFSARIGIPLRLPPRATEHLGANRAARCGPHLTRRAYLDGDVPERDLRDTLASLRANVELARIITLHGRSDVLHRGRGENPRLFSRRRKIEQIRAALIPPSRLTVNKIEEKARHIQTAFWRRQARNRPATLQDCSGTIQC